jgi:phage-related protein
MHAMVNLGYLEKKRKQVFFWSQKHTNFEEVIAVTFISWIWVIIGSIPANLSTILTFCKELIGSFQLTNNVCAFVCVCTYMHGYICMTQTNLIHNH